VYVANPFSLTGLLGFYNFLLPFVKAGLADRVTPMTGTKRACDYEYQGAKRPRQGDSAIDAQTISDFRWQGKELSIMASDSDHNNDSGDNFAARYLAQSLSRHVDIESIGDNESFVPNVSLVDFLTFLKLFGHRESHNSKSDSMH
jgi:hypothetical protein